MGKVLVFGVFDRLHQGHINFLNQARKYGNHLVAVVTRDSNVKMLKGRPPLQNEKERMGALEKYADEVLLGEKKVTYRLIKKLDPDVICIGYDQQPSVEKTKEILKWLDMKEVAVKKMRPHKPTVYKSSRLNEL